MTDLKKIFQEASDNVPDLFRGTQPLAVGSFALVVDHLDGTVSKVFFRYRDDNEMQKTAEDVFETETKILQILNGRAFDDVRTPELIDISTINFPEDSSVFASYRMTKMTGEKVDWDSLLKTPVSANFKKHFEKVGALLAGFGQTYELSVIEAPEGVLKWSDRIATVSSLDTRTNDALEICDHYLRQNVTPGIVHGDFHHGNYVTSDGTHISGLFDFGLSGLGRNSLMDMARLPEATMPHVISQFEKTSGKTVDPDLMAMTKISLCACVLKWRDENPDANRSFDAHQRLITGLNQVQHITGMDF